MSLEELKSDWNSLTIESLQSMSFAEEDIQQALSARYKSSINKTMLFDLFLMLTYGYLFALITFRFEVLEKPYLEALGIISIAILLLLFFLKLTNMINIYRWSYHKFSYTEVIRKLARKSMRTKRIQLLNICSGFLLTITLVVLIVKIYNEYDITQSGYFWAIVLSCSLAFILLLNRWMMDNYRQSMEEAQNLLTELKQ